MNVGYMHTLYISSLTAPELVYLSKKVHVFFKKNPQQNFLATGLSHTTQQNFEIAAELAMYIVNNGN